MGCGGSRNPECKQKYTNAWGAQARLTGDGTMGADSWQVAMTSWLANNDREDAENSKNKVLIGDCGQITGSHNMSLVESERQREKMRAKVFNR